MKKGFLCKLIALVFTVSLVLSFMMPVGSYALVYENDHGYCWFFDDEYDVQSLLVAYSAGTSPAYEEVEGVEALAITIKGADPYIAWAVGDTDITNCPYAVMYAYYRTEHLEDYAAYAVGSFRILCTGEGKNFWTMNWGQKYEANVWKKYIVDLSDPDGPDMNFWDNNGTADAWHECYYPGLQVGEIRNTLVNNADSRCLGDAVIIKCIAFFDTLEAAEAFTPFADYTAVDAALASVPADLSVYSESRVSDVTKAVNNVVRNLSSFDQPTVDMYASKISEAVAALSSEPDPTETPTEVPTEVPTEAPAASTPKADDKAEKDGGLGTGAIIGIIAAAAAVIAAIIIIIAKKKK